MTFLTSILLGLCMGSSAYFAIQYGKKDFADLQKGIFLSFLLIGGIAILLNVFVFINVDWIIKVLQVPEEIRDLSRDMLYKEKYIKVKREFLDKKSKEQ